MICKYVWMILYNMATFSGFTIPTYYTTLSGNLSGFLLYILETREYCDVIKVLLHSKFSDHVTRA